jgi:hypothetical protein
MSTTIIIRQTEGAAERMRAIDYISRNMRIRHGACPPPETTPPYLFVAFDGDEIVGSLGILFGQKDAELPIEEFFHFDRALVPIPYVREKTIYYSRWNSSRPGIGPAIWLAASLYAKQCGTVYTTQTITDVMLQRYQSFGCTWHPIPGVTVREENIAETERVYFFAEDGPRPWVGVLEEQLRDLPKIVESICSRIPLSFEQ